MKEKAGGKLCLPWGMFKMAGGLAKPYLEMKVSLCAPGHLPLTWKMSNIWQSWKFQRI
jgi:hypothetical protein